MSVHNHSRCQVPTVVYRGFGGGYFTPEGGMEGPWDDDLDSVIADFIPRKRSKLD